MGRSNNQDIHDRHSAESEVPVDEPVAESDAEQPTGKPKFSWPGKDAKEQQAIRDSFYKEDGVKADLTGGKVPESE